jgi:hypothetical protein
MFPSPLLTMGHACSNLVPQSQSRKDIVLSSAILNLFKTTYISHGSLVSFLELAGRNQDWVDMLLYSETHREALRLGSVVGTPSLASRSCLIDSVLTDDGFEWSGSSGWTWTRRLGWSSSFILYSAENEERQRSDLDPAERSSSEK